MEYNFLDSGLNIKDITLNDSDKINHYLLKNHNVDVMKALDFFADNGKLLYIHGFLGTGKRQFINYVLDFLDKDIITLKYFCKQATVCDDILLSFIDTIEKNALSKAVSHTAKITTLGVKFEQYLSSIKKPFLIILEAYDDVLEENKKLIEDFLITASKNENVKIILSTRAMIQDILGEVKVDKKIFLKALSKDLFKDYIRSFQINGTDNGFEDFYKYSRGYYYYTALAVKIMKAMELSLNDFLAKFTMSGMSFDSYLGVTYINLIPNAIRNFFWFLRTIRHGISLNALAVLELYDDTSIDYLKNNLMIYVEDEIVYVQDYFQQDIDISIPNKTDIKLRKYIINIYEKELKEPLQTRSILISRQALRTEIEYHKKRISELESSKSTADKSDINNHGNPNEHNTKEEQPAEKTNINNKILEIKKLAEAKNYTDAIEGYKKIIDEFSPNSNTIAEIRIELARLYKLINDYPSAQHYYEIVEMYYKQNEEYINLNYLYYELTNLYFAMYKVERAIETIKKVIYSVDTPQSLMVDACVRLGNIYTDTTNLEEAYKYYIKALESVDENTPESEKSELYFKLALVCDERDDEAKAFEYYNKCIIIDEHNSYKPAAYSNLGSCYYEHENYSDALDCFTKAYKMEKENNNYEGIYYVSSYLAKIYTELQNKDKTLEFLLEARQCADFINEDFYILEATIALGDYYYDYKDKNSEALSEYCKARRIAQNYGSSIDINKIEERIKDMELRMDNAEVKKIEERYGK